MPITQSERLTRQVAQSRVPLLPAGNTFSSLYVQEGPSVATPQCVIQLGNTAPVQIVRGMTIDNIPPDDALFGVYGTWTAGPGFVHLLAGVANGAGPR